MAQPTESSAYALVKRGLCFPLNLIHFAQAKQGKPSDMYQNGVVDLQMHFDSSLYLDGMKLGTEGWFWNPQHCFRLLKPVLVLPFCINYSLITTDIEFCLKNLCLEWSRGVPKDVLSPSRLSS